MTLYPDTDSTLSNRTQQLQKVSKDTDPNSRRSVSLISQRTIEMQNIVLVVEDNEHLREPICELLRLSDFAVLAAGNGSQALEMLRSCGTRIDVLLVDINLPGMSGDEVARRAGEVLPELRVVYMSSSPRIDFVRRGQLPADALFLDKPFLRAVLVEKIREALTKCTEETANCDRNIL